MITIYSTLSILSSMENRRILQSSSTISIKLFRTTSKTAAYSSIAQLAFPEYHLTHLELDSRHFLHHEEGENDL